MLVLPLYNKCNLRLKNSVIGTLNVDTLAGHNKLSFERHQIYFYQVWPGVPCALMAHRTAGHRRCHCQCGRARAGRGEVRHGGRADVSLDH